jgi:hypothetical protein
MGNKLDGILKIIYAYQAYGQDRKERVNKAMP